MTNKIHDAFDEIEASEELRSSTVQFLQAEREKCGSGQVRRPAWRMPAAVCAALALFVCLGWYYTVRVPVSYVSIDVNPSVELALNFYDRVVSAAAYNEDGEIVLDGVDVKGKLYTDAIDTIVDSSAMQPYLTKDSALTFTVAAGDSDKESAILSGIEKCSGCQEHGGQSYTADVSSIAEAHDSGLSFGKYAAYLVLSGYDSTVTAEDCRHMSMAEIHSMIREHENECGHENESEDENKCGHESVSEDESKCGHESEDEHGHGE